MGSEIGSKLRYPYMQSHPSEKVICKSLSSYVPFRRSLGLLIYRACILLTHDYILIPTSPLSTIASPNKPLGRQLKLCFL